MNNQRKPVGVYVYFKDRRKGNTIFRQINNQKLWPDQLSIAPWGITDLEEDEDVALTDSLDVIAYYLGRNIPVVYVGDLPVSGTLIVHAMHLEIQHLLFCLQKAYLVAKALRQFIPEGDLSGLVRFTVLVRHS